MSTPPPDVPAEADPPDRSEPRDLSELPPKKPPDLPDASDEAPVPERRPNAAAMGFGIVAGVFALLGIVTLVAAGICTAMLSGLGV